MAATSSNNTISPAWKSCFRPDLFSGKVALVTGGGTGLGLCIATELAILGATVVISSRDASKCQRAADEVNRSDAMRTSSGKIEVGPSTNVRDEDQIVALVSHIVDAYGGLHLLVNNAGGQFVSATEDISKRGFAAVIETNLQGTFLMMREAYTQYMRDHGGNIVNITLNNRNGFPMLAHSGAARAGVENLSATLSSEWMESGVRVNCVRPGIMWTDSGFENYGPAGDMFVEKLLPALPAKRFGTAEEVSSAVTWLLSEGASYVSGAILCVDGASAYHFVPLIDIEDKCHLPVYGSLPAQAKL